MIFDLFAKNDPERIHQGDESQVDSGADGYDVIPHHLQGKLYQNAIIMHTYLRIKRREGYSGLVLSSAPGRLIKHNVNSEPSANPSMLEACNGRTYEKTVAELWTLNSSYGEPRLYPRRASGMSPYLENWTQFSLHSLLEFSEFLASLAWESGVKLPVQKSKRSVPMVDPMLCDPGWLAFLYRALEKVCCKKLESVAE